MQPFDINDLLQKLKGLDQRKAEDEIYAQIYDEYSSGVMDKVAQARAIAASNGNEAKIKSEYIKNRFIRIKDELAELKRFEQEYQRKQEEELQQRRAKEEAEKRKEEDENRKEFERLKRIADRDARYDAYHEKANSTGGGLFGSLIVVFLSLIVGLAIIWSMAILAIGTS